MHRDDHEQLLLTAANPRPLLYSLRIKGFKLRFVRAARTPV